MKPYRTDSYPFSKKQQCKECTRTPHYDSDNSTDTAERRALQKAQIASLADQMAVQQKDLENVQIERDRQIAHNMQEGHADDMQELVKLLRTSRDENKDLKRELEVVREENEELRAKLKSFNTESDSEEHDDEEKKCEDGLTKKISVETYMNWTADELAHWVISLNQKEFAKYDSALREGFERDGICGKSMRIIDKSAWKSWGVTSRADRNAIQKHLAALLLRYDKDNDIVI